jgi:hypothetical protein
MTHSSNDHLRVGAFAALMFSPLACTDDGPADGNDGSDAGETATATEDTTGNDTDAVDCSGRPIAVPSARGEIEGIWDAERGRMLVFAGDRGTPVMCMNQTEFVAEVWAFHTDCDNFEQLAPGQGMPARGRYAIALDSARGRALLHGGRYRAGTSGTYTLYDDLWSFDLATDTWIELPSNGGPSPRSNHVAAVVDDRLLIFGGNASNDGLNFIPLDDTWVFDLDAEVWSQVNTTNTPAARLFHAATVTPDGKTFIIYGGGDQNAFLGPFFRDLWALQLGPDGTTGTWTLLDDGQLGPPGTTWGDLVFDAAGQRVILWAGHDDGALGNTNTLWAWETSSWEQLETGDVLDVGANGFCDFPADFVTPDLDAPERRSAGASVLTDTGELLIFGGKTDCGLINDVWSWSLAEQTWTERSPATVGEICLRAYANCQTMCF